jgi:hypothetical protein
MFNTARTEAPPTIAAPPSNTTYAFIGSVVMQVRILFGNTMHLHLNVTAVCIDFMG